MSPYSIMMGLILILTPLICWLFTLGCKESRTPFSKMAEEIHNKRYYLHALGYIFIIKWKALTDKLNEPIKESTGNFTNWIYSIEGNAALWFQETFQNAWLTAFLNFHYH